MNDLEEIGWFVLKVRFQRAVIAKNKLAEHGIEVYLPMELRAVKTKGGGECVKLMPILSDLIFVKTDFQKLRDICAVYKYLYYQSEKTDGVNRAIRIPDNQMSQFQDFISGNYENIDCKITKLKSGQKIVIKSGIFKGCKIIFKQEKGKTTKEYKIEINGIDWNFTEEAFKLNILSRI